MPIRSRERRLLKNTKWLIKLRWIAIFALYLFIAFAYFSNAVYTKYYALIIVSICLIAENILAILFVKYIEKNKLGIKYTLFNIYFQIIDDLLLLTLILHFTSGVENPLYLVYIFHMVIASVMLSRKEAFSIAALAISLFGMLIYAEYMGIIPHHCLCIDYFPDYGLYFDFSYITRIFSAFLILSLILVYITNTLGNRLRNQEEMLNKAIDKLREKDKIKNEYVLRLNHDIKNDLSAIQTNLSVLTTNVFGELDENKKKFVDTAYNRTVKLTDFVKQLLHLTKLRLKDEEPRFIFSLKDMLEELIVDFQALADKRNIKIQTWIDPEICNLKGNKFSINEAFGNLISNAIKYSPENSKVEIVAICRGDYIKVEIRDEGIGIPEEDKVNIFKEFYRASNARNSKIKGTGVGLSLTKQIIVNHGGTINFENRKPKGTRFTIELPNKS
jgi:signal transduction histidine kinase